MTVSFELFCILFEPQLADCLYDKVWKRHFAEMRWLAAMSILHVSALLEVCRNCCPHFIRCSKDAQLRDGP